LIRLQRSGKSASPCGSDQTACRWSGNTQIAIVLNGFRDLVLEQTCSCAGAGRCAARGRHSICRQE
jgi:hypothetical protein